MDINTPYPDILKQARQLSERLGESSIYRRFTAAQSSIGKDREGTRILTMLIEMGERINRGEQGVTESAEAKVVIEGMEKNPLVKEFLVAQKEYLQLLEDVMSRIKNPQKNQKKPQ